MKESISLSQQGLSQLILESQNCLDKMEKSQTELMATLQDLSPFFNLKLSSFVGGNEFEAFWESWKAQLKNFFFYLQEAQLAYQDLSEQIKELLLGRNAQDPLFQEISRQGALLTKDLQARQNLAKCLIECEQVLDRIVQLKKMTPQQKQRIEDLVFRLQLF